MPCDLVVDDAGGKPRSRSVCPHVVRTRSALVLVLALGGCGDKESASPHVSTEGPVDGCAFMPAGEVEARIGDPAGPAHSVAVQLPTVAMCRQTIAGGLQATLTLRSLTDWGAMADGGTVLNGLGDQAVSTQRGVMLKIAGRPYFFHVQLTGENGIEQDKSIELAKIVANAAR
jgi:hypothetical protein